MRLRMGGLNFTLPRKIDGQRVRVPVIAGLKVGLTGEMFLLDLMKVLLPNLEGAIVDVGVNIGQTLAKAKLADPVRPYFGFEPNPVCFHYLEKFIEVNDWQNVTLFPFGIAEQTAVLSLYSATEKATDSEASFLPDANPGHTAERTRHAAVFDYSSIAPLVSPDMAFLKIDVEGMEPEVLKSLAPAIQRDRPVIVIEMLTIDTLANRHKRSVSLLQSHGYRVFLIGTDNKRRLARLTEIRAYENIDAPLKADYVALTNGQIEFLDPALFTEG